MKTLKELYRIGRGPSSSHTIGPQRICEYAMQRFEDATNYKVTLYGSLASTGVGHGTDTVIAKTLIKPVEIVFNTHRQELLHPNTMELEAYKDGTEIGFLRAYSVGGGAIKIAGERETELPEIYPHKNFSEIREYCESEEIRLFQYVERFEGAQIFDYLAECWQQMRQTIKEGLKATGIIPGGLEITRKARSLYMGHHIDESPETKENRLVCAYAYAVSEQNASGCNIVTAPTCGSAGVLPSVLYYMQEKHGFKDEQIINALATAGIIGNVIKQNASISGAECGCQAEIGSACSMAAAGLAELFEMEHEQIEYAAEVAMEHHIGLTCDPVLGLVQIPCIERNAVAAMRAINALSLANFLTYTRKISFDTIVENMYETGKDLSRIYRETSEGGLAKLYRKP